MAFNKHPKRDKARKLITLKEIRRGVPIFMSKAFSIIRNANLEREAKRFRNGKNQIPSRILGLRRPVKKAI